MLPTERLIKEISEVLAAGKAGEHPVSTLANDYAAFCHDANQRLAQCIAMIEKGNDYQALQLAETEPNLMDLVGGLSFGGSLAWRDFCANNALTVPERLDAKYVKALNALYAKGISANHPLYKDYRAAVMERKDEKAIQIIRTITRVNPSDANAKMELERLLNKLFQAKLAELKGALLSNDEGATVGLVDEIETIAPPAKLAQFREYAQAKDVRWVFRRRLIFGELRVAAGRLEEVRALGTWQEVGGTLEKVQRLQIEKPFDPTEEEQALLAATRKFHDQEQERSAQETRFRNALGALGEQVERAEVRIANRSAATLRLVEVEYLTLSKRWQEVERFSKPIPEDLQARVRRNLNLNYLIDDSGTKYQTPLLKLLDDLVGQKDAPPLFKAFVMRRLQELINVRPYAWGVQWCPSLRKDFATLAKLDQDDPVRSSDWMVPRRNRELGPKFATFFDSISGHSYLREAIVIRELVTTIFGDGLVFAGYVGADGTPKIVPEAAGNELWTTGSDGEGPVCFKPKKSDSKFEPVESVAPFMPLFYVRADRAELLADACKKYSVGSNLADLQAALPPFFTMTSK